MATSRPKKNTSSGKKLHGNIDIYFMKKPSEHDEYVQKDSSAPSSRPCLASTFYESSVIRFDPEIYHELEDKNSNSTEMVHQCASPKSLPCVTRKVMPVIIGVLVSIIIIETIVLSITPTCLTPVASSSTSQNNKGPVFAIDEQKSDTNFFQSAAEEYPWLSIDLCDDQFITSVQLFGSTSNAKTVRNGLKGKLVEIRIVPTKVTAKGEKISVTTMCGTKTLTGDVDEKIDFTCINPTLGRYITVQMINPDDPYFLILNEVQWTSSRYFKSDKLIETSIVSQKGDSAIIKSLHIIVLILLKTLLSLAFPCVLDIYMF